ncbi:sodium:proton antiporter [Hahella sp. CCB-MM4]|uniref:cation:proton antiporter n=1 Tax=Hahella sp. (strain CCB-MM4) TaxID=1926491 RepID=UPI000B9BD01E|nr:sodium:proton antiporter [Hahella sp. CCB-MM4]OZG70515.1 sodium:proton antiporter [Hahella sp. CCB-MM4]
MNEHLVIGLAAIIFFGVTAQYVAWRLKLPSILLLLISGFVLGPISGLLSPDEQFGELLFPAISFAVAIILFEGGLSLKIRELKMTSGVVRKLVSIGLVTTFILSFLISKFTLDIPWVLAILFGAILTVTGPTVVLPLLMLIRPKGQIGSILKWEGILNDPIGALFAVLIFEAVVSASVGQATTLFLSGFMITIFLGALMGLPAGMLVATSLKHHWIPEFLNNAFTLAIVITLFAVSNLIQPESGLFSVTVMGIYLGNQRLVSIRNIVGFKEDLRVLLLSSLFIVLAARLQFSDLQQIHIGSIILLIMLVVVVRPAAVWLSSIGSNLSWQERVFLSSMAPRGIVAAAVISLFAVRLESMGIEGSEILAPNMFLIIVGTILIYGLAARPLAKTLHLSDDNPQGCVILGSNILSIALAKALKAEGISTTIIDAQWANIKEARMEGLNTLNANILSETVQEKINFTGMGKFLALTSNLELNSLACIRFSDIFGLKEVYQLGEPEDKDKPAQWIPDDLSGVALFGPNSTYNELIKRIHHGAKVKRTPLTKDFSYDDYKTQNEGKNPVLLCIVTENKSLLYVTVNKKIQPKPGQVIISLIDS